jgi:hypothetical protein
LILHTLARYGVKVVVDGDRMKLVKPVGKALPADLIDAARQYKDELRALAGKAEPPPAAAWSLEDWQAFFDEAAGVAEVDIHCGGAGDAHPLLPFGTERAGHAWLHAGCHPAWHDGRKAKAVAALAEVGISKPQPVTAAEAIRRGLVFEYVTGKISAADE